MNPHGPVSRGMDRALRVGLAWILLAAGLGVGAAFAQSPPSDLRLEGDHWTAWNPPPVPEGAQVYFIERGDTLWDLSARFLGDPYLWPQIWERNQYILDAHWIYPGDPLFLDGLVQLTADAGAAGAPLDDAATAQLDDGLDDPFATVIEGDEVDDSVFDPSFSAPGMSATPVPLGSESDIYCSGYIGDPGEEFAYRIHSSEYEHLNPAINPDRDSNLSGLFGLAQTQKVFLDYGDIVYLDSGRSDGLSAGELLTVILPSRMVVDPRDSEAVIGQYYSYLGQVRVVSAQDDSSIGEIIKSCEPIPVGSSLRLFEPEPVPLRRRSPMRPANYPVRSEELATAPTIIASPRELVTLSTGLLVFIDQGEAQDILPGDVFTIYRTTREGVPPVVLGELGILSVRDQTALGSILESRYTIHVGDRILLK